MHVWAYVRVCKSLSAITHMYFACFYQCAGVYPCIYHEPVNKQVLLSIYTHIGLCVILLYDFFFKKTKKKQKSDKNRWHTVRANLFYIAIAIFFLLIQLTKTS